MILNEPPAIYDHPYTGIKSTTILTSEEIIKVCAKGPTVLACSIPGKHSCLVFLPKISPGGVGPAMYKFLVRWENARCNGWSDKNARVY